MLAAVQAPIIMMSQNRQAARDRMTMIRDFEVNLKADAAISELNQRLDHLAWQVLADLDQIKRAQKIDPTAPTPPAAGKVLSCCAAGCIAASTHQLHVCHRPTLARGRWHRHPSRRRGYPAAGCAQSGGRWASRPG